MDIPTITGVFGSPVIAALLSGLVTWRRGKEIGRIEGETRWMDSVREGAELVITEMTSLHQDCLDKHAECEEKYSIIADQLKELMSREIPPYHLNKDKLDD